MVKNYVITAVFNGVYARYTALQMLGGNNELMAVLSALNASSEVVSMSVHRGAAGHHPIKMERADLGITDDSDLRKLK